MCDTLVVVSGDGCLFAKNSDRDPNEAQALDWRPRATHAPGASVRCTWLEIPQVPSTQAVLLSRPFWMFGAEIGANEHGVVIGNEAVFTREPYAATGLTGMDLLRLALERARSADEAVQVIVTLLERHGQGGGCGHENRAFTYHNSFLVADPRGALVLETAGRHYATERVAGARSISNLLTIPSFARAHSDRIKTRVASGRARLARTSELCRLAKSPADLMALLRDHGAGQRWPRYARSNGAMRAPCMHAGGLVAASQTTASWVASLGAGGEARHWVTATAAPCLSVFKPVRVGEPLDLGPAPTDRFDPHALWWRHERLHRPLIANPEPLADAFAAERDALEAAFEAEGTGPAEAFARADALLTRWLERVSALPAADRRPPIARAYWRKRDARAGLFDRRPA